MAGIIIQLASLEQDLSFSRYKFYILDWWSAYC